MWLWLLIALGINFAPAHLAYSPSAEAMDTSNGPTSHEEAEILWADGQKEFNAGKYQDAVNDLARLVDRYPGATGYLEAHRLLGRSFMKLGRAQEAIAPLQSYISATGDRELGLEARLWLGDAYLKLDKPNDAYFTALEIEKATKQAKNDLYARSQFLKARALVALNRDSRAQSVIDSVESLPVVQSDTALKGYVAQERIDLKLRRCAKFPAQGAMNEAQARDQFSRRALCLQEALVLFKAAAESRELGTGNESAEQLFQGFKSYSAAVRNPPAPPRLRPSDRTPKQRAEYLAELSAKLDQDRKKAIRDSVSTLTEWKDKSTSRAADLYARLAREIETLI